MKYKITRLAMGLVAVSQTVSAEEFFSNTTNISQEHTVSYFTFPLAERQTLDIYTNGPTTDSQIHLFRGGSQEINLQSHLGTDDDSCPNGRCGPAGAYSNALIDDIPLERGNYTVAISDYGVVPGDSFTKQEAVNGSNDILREGDITLHVSSSDTIDPTSGPTRDSFQVHDAIARMEVERARSQQVIRQTNLDISRHLMSEISRSFSFGMEETNPLAASSDNAKSSYSPDLFWSKVNYSNLSEDGKTTKYTTDLYQFIAGIDKKIGDFYFGSALTYAYGDSKQLKNDNTSNTVSITPYFAYKINKSFFASALLAYNYTHINGTTGNNDADVHDYSGEFNLNGFHKIGVLSIKGRAGIRYNHNFTSLENSLDADFDGLTWMGDIEFGYNINESLSVYAGTLYEYKDIEAYNISSFPVASSGVVHDSALFVRAGFDYRIVDNLYVGLNASIEVIDEDNDLFTVGLNMRIEL